MEDCSSLYRTTAPVSIFPAIAPLQDSGTPACGNGYIFLAANSTLKVRPALVQRSWHGCPYRRNSVIRPRVLLADDHRLVAEGLKRLLAEEFELVGVVEDGRAMVAAAKNLRPDVIVADIAMPHLNGIDAVAR